MNDIGFPNVNTIVDKPSTLQPHHVMKLWRHKPKIFFKDVMDLTLDLWQEDCVELYMTHQRIGMIASKGPGKLEPCSNEIYTPKGKIRFGDLKPGDYVFSEYGSATKVTQIHPQGIKDIYEVTFDDGSKAHCGLEHLWKVRGITEKRKGTWAVLTLRELIDKGISKMQGSQKYYPWQIPSQGAAEFSKKELPIDPYVLGVWIGDGTRLLDTYSKPDIYVEDEINRRGYKTRRYDRGAKCDQIRIIGVKENLKLLGLLHKYCYEKHIPEIYKTASVEQRMDLLRGLMDTDGTIDTRSDRGSTCEYNTTSSQLAKDTMWLIRSLGGKCSVVTREPKFEGRTYRTDYRVRVTTPFNPFSLPRKAQHWKKPSQDRYLMRTIKDVKLIGREEAMCITVECPNHCYLTNDFIVTHNTFLLNCLGWHFFITHHQPKIAALSISKDHLMSNLWAELLKWRAKSRLLKNSTNEGFSKITLKGHEGYSFIDARAYPKQADETQQASALAGLHSDNVAFLIDEAGMIPDAVLSTADAALSTGDAVDKKARLICTGNPEYPKGILYRAYKGRSIQKWGIYTVSGDPLDPKRAPRVSVAWAQEQIDTYGRDHPWVMVNVLAQYPNVTVDFLISEEDVQIAMKREVREKEVENSQHRMGVDVARGGIDSSIFSRRRGLIAYPFEEMPSNVLGPEMAGKIVFTKQEKGIERVFVDDTGGYGSSVIDSLQLFPTLDVTGIKYNSSAQDKTRYFNRRTEMWVRMRDWIRKGGKLPNDPKLTEELTCPKLYFQGGVLRLEEKDQIKARIGRSPDRADALAQTFADPEEQSANANFPSPGGNMAHKDMGIHLSDESQIDNRYKRVSNYIS
jgi:hypothetical protein